MFPVAVIETKIVMRKITAVKISKINKKDPQSGFTHDDPFGIFVFVTSHTVDKIIRR
jgi:hypothetical protein